MLKTRKSTKLLCAAISFIMLFSSLITAAAAAPSYAYHMINSDDALHTKGDRIYNAKGQEVRLRGINLGGWLIQEEWFCPTSNNSCGDWYTMETLEKRFGTEKMYALYDSYQDNWITEADFKNIADMGYNCVRIPFWYRNFQIDDNGTWRRDKHGNIDLSRLEWAVEMCRKYGLYAIPDLHGANGAQGNVDHCGRKFSYHFFDKDEKGEWYRAQACELWSVIARHFKDDPVIACFDLLNEPTCNDIGAPMEKYVPFYDDAYKAIRKEDPKRLISMIAVWNASKLPVPSKYGWTGVIYQFHFYNSTKLEFSQGTRAFYYRFNVPVLAGEFHPTERNGILTCDMTDVLDAFEEKNTSWTQWTYKGMNGWAEGSDWFLYASNYRKCKIDPEKDSYETLMSKWGERLRTDSGLFKPSTLYDYTKKHLPKAPLPTAPINTQKDVDKANEPLNEVFALLRAILEKVANFFKKFATIY